MSDESFGGVVEGSPAPLGAYPHFRVVPPFVFLSGTSARQPDDTIRGASVDDRGAVLLDIAEQTSAVVENIATVLASVGLGLTDLVDVTTFLVDMDDFDGYNAVYGEFFAGEGPARTTVAVRRLPHPHLLIEIKAVARLREGGARGEP